jgi:hypothetical protein
MGLVGQVRRAGAKLRDSNLRNGHLPYPPNLPYLTYPTYPTYPTYADLSCLVVKAVAAVSLVYDLTAGLALLLLRGPIVRLIPTLATVLTASPVLADLLGIFLTCVGLGYLLPYRQPHLFRSYLWIFGVALKTAGAAAFVLDYAWRGSAALMLLFALSDAAVAALTLVALVSDRGGTRDRAGFPTR